MTSKEIVKRAVLFKGPERIPYDLPEPYGSDFLHLGADPDWSKVRFPDYEKKERYIKAKKKIEENKEEKFVLAHIPFSLIYRFEYSRGCKAQGQILIYNQKNLINFLINYVK